MLLMLLVMTALKLRQCWGPKTKWDYGNNRLCQRGLIILFKEQTRNAEKNLMKGGKHFVHDAFFVSCSSNNKNLGIQDQKVSVHEQILFRSIQKHNALDKQLIIHQIKVVNSSASPWDKNISQKISRGYLKS